MFLTSQLESLYLTLSILSFPHLRLLSLSQCVELCVIPMPSRPTRGQGKGTLKNKALFTSTVLVYSLSHFLFSPLLSLSLTSLVPAVHQPPAVLPAVAALWTNSLTTMQVRGREKEHTALTIDQRRPLKQSLPFSPSLLSPCQGWKRQPLERWMRRGPLQAKHPLRHPFSS